MFPRDFWNMCISCFVDNNNFLWALILQQNSSMHPLRVCYLRNQCLLKERCNIPGDQEIQVTLKHVTDTFLMGFNVSLTAKTTNVQSVQNGPYDGLLSLQRNKSDIILLPYSIHGNDLCLQVWIWWQQTWNLWYFRCDGDSIKRNQLSLPQVLDPVLSAYVMNSWTPKGTSLKYETCTMSRGIRFWWQISWRNVAKVLLWSLGKWRWSISGYLRCCILFPNEYYSTNTTWRVLHATFCFYYCFVFFFLFIVLLVE